MQDTGAKPDFVGAMKVYNETRGMPNVSIASVASRFPGITTASLQRRVSGTVEVDAKPV
jgi:hypothetical protein